jgi:hypothetical protein
MLRWFLVCLALLLSFAASSAYAAQRTFVATTGSDANTASNCSNTAPCRGFTAALTVTDSGGEIIVLTSGGYGPVTIDKSVSIIAPEGVYAGISVFSGHGITIATAGVNVVLRGLSINRLGGIDDGINMTAGDSLVVQNCTISNFSSGNGLHISTSARVRLLDSQVRSNYRGAHLSGGATVLVSGSRFLDNTVQALYASAFGAGVVTKVEMSRSEVSSNGAGGFTAYASGSGRIELNVKDSIAARNSYGVDANASTGTALARVSNSLISGNTDFGLRASGSGAKLLASGNEVSDNGTGLQQSSSAVLQSTGDNTVSNNTTNASGTITSLANM